MNLERIQALVDLVAASNVSEVTVRTPDGRVTVRRGVVRATHETAAEQPGAHSNGSSLGTNGTNGSEPAVVQPLPVAESVRAPMVGVFHPADPPVGVGDRVRKGEIVCLIESMRLMNEVRAEQNGLVAEVLIEEGMPVEYGQPLFSLDSE